MGHSMWRFLLFLGTFAAVANCQEDVAENTVEDPAAGAAEDEGFLRGGGSQDPEGDVDNHYSHDGIEETAINSESLQSLHTKIDADSDGKITLPEIFTFSQLTRKAVR